MIRKATVKDVEAMKNIINTYAKQEKMLPRSYNELYQHIRSFYVYEKDGDYRLLRPAGGMGGPGNTFVRCQA